MENEDVPVVRCFGVPDEDVTDVGKEARVPAPYGPPLKYVRRKSVTIFNEKTGKWETHGLVEHHERCPVCGRLMLVQAIWGTTYLALCSEECNKKFNEKYKEMGNLHETLRYFRERK